MNRPRRWVAIDEAQDMDAHEYALIQALMEHNEEMRVIAVGDDDQNIYEFRGASSEYMVNLILEKQATLYELVENYRSKSNLVQFSNQFAARIPLRLKDTPIIPKQTDLGKIKLVRYHSNQSSFYPAGEGHAQGRAGGHHLCLDQKE